MKRKYFSDGFSLIELVICIALLTTGIIFVIGLFTRMLQASTKGGDLSAGAYVAESQLDRLLFDQSQLNTVITSSGRNGIYQDTPIAYAYGQNEPPAIASLNNTTFYITYHVNTPVAPPIPSLGATFARNIYFVDVQVDWWQQPDVTGNAPSRQNMGHLETHMGRLFYVSPSMESVLGEQGDPTNGQGPISTGGGTTGGGPPGCPGC